MFTDDDNPASSGSMTSALEKRKAEHSLRKLTLGGPLVDLCSNDYLGLARSEELSKAIQDSLKEHKSAHGSGGSRLLTGNTAFAEELEKFIANYHRSEAALIYNSGYDANLGLLSCIAGKGDTLIYDERCHASIYDGVRLSKANTYPFRHNDLGHLNERLKIAGGTTYVIIESIYSMDGDLAPLEKIAEVCKATGAKLIVDEAHATGIFGEKGRGRVSALGLEKEVFARVHTFGKALGCHGAAILGSSVLREFLVNFSRSFIYTTALPLHSLKAIRCAYEFLSDDKILNINELIRLFKELSKNNGIPLAEDSPGPIQCIIIPGNEQVRAVAAIVIATGYDVRPILSPTVPSGSERLRICIHTFNSPEELKGLVNTLKKAFTQ